ncbi:hypothetical protein GGF37_002213, partial [Kickxella alabastrina]
WLAHSRHEHFFCQIYKGAKKVFKPDPAKLAKARENLWHTSVEDAERASNHPGSSTLNFKLYIAYLLERHKGKFVLSEHYHNTQTLGKSRKYDGSRKCANVELAKSMRAKFGSDTVLILGNWTQNLKHKHHITMAAAASNYVAATTTATSDFVVAAVTIVSVATATAVVTTSFTDIVQQGCNQWILIHPQAADIIRCIGEEKGWSKRKISRKVKQQLWNELAEQNWEQQIHI